MLVMPINSIYNKNLMNRMKAVKQDPESDDKKEVGSSSFMPYQPNFLGNISLNVKNIENTKLYSTYLKSGSSLFEFIKNIKANRVEVFEFLFGITKDENLSKDFITEINAEPRKADENTKILLNKIGSERFKSWYYHKDGYQRAYERYFKKEIFENDSKTVSDMIKISPNLMIDALKLKSLRTTGTASLRR